jgi:hypothetical protein
MTPRSLLTRNTLLPVAGAVVLLLGFADLVRGGVTLAPILLVVGYLVLVPLSLRFGGRQDAPSPRVKRQPRAADRRLTSNQRGLLLASPVLLVAFVPLVANWHPAERRGDYTTIAFAHDLLDSVEPYSVLVTYGDNDTFPLWYAQEVEGVRKDVTVAVLSLLNTDWYVRGIIRRPIYSYDVPKGPSIYRGRSWPKPIGSPIHMTVAQADSIPDYVLLRQPMLLRKAGITAMVTPQNLPQTGDGSGILERKDIAVLRMVADSWPQRPIYFSRTTGNYAQSLGLDRFLLSQGLASKLFLPPATASRDTVHLRGAGWFDLPRSKALFIDVFQGPSAIEKKGDWVDRPSVGIPLTYIFAAEELAAVLRSQGQSASAAAVLDTGSRIAHAVHEESTYTAIHNAWQSVTPSKAAMTGPNP